MPSFKIDKTEQLKQNLSLNYVLKYSITLYNKRGMTMLEIPETMNLSNQIRRTLTGKRVAWAKANGSEHKFTWYYKNDPEKYSEVLKDKIITDALPFGGMLEVQLEGVKLLFTDGVSLKYLEKAEKRPLKHQLIIEFEDKSALTATVQMYGGVWCFTDKDIFDNPYYAAAKEKPCVFSDSFSHEYFMNIINTPEAEKLSIKALMATEQRIPGLGNGVLQDILWSARINPRKKAYTLKSQEKEKLYLSLKTVLKSMYDQGGRDTEKDLYGNNGGYKTILSKNTVASPCPACGQTIIKENFLGGSIYYCPKCQPK